MELLVLAVLSLQRPEVVHHDGDGNEEPDDESHADGREDAQQYRERAGDQPETAERHGHRRQRRALAFRVGDGGVEVQQVPERDDAGWSWTRLDGATGRSYFRETLVHDGRLYAAATAGPSTTWRGPDGADAALFESDDGGETFRSIPYPGGGREAVLAWAVDGRRVLAGTDRGRVLVRRSDGWETLATVPAGIRSMTVV